MAKLSSSRNAVASQSWAFFIFFCAVVYCKFWYMMSSASAGSSILMRPHQHSSAEPWPAPLPLPSSASRPEPQTGQAFSWMCTPVTVRFCFPVPLVDGSRSFFVSARAQLSRSCAVANMTKALLVFEYVYASPASSACSSRFRRRSALYALVRSSFLRSSLLKVFFFCSTRSLIWDSVKRSLSRNNCRVTLGFFDMSRARSTHCSCNA
mmetsp:Transcript_43443/g.136173  ORF Transcript_43443/g.136173 Transcript_43443/m.136173 type:complete len:208 (+) Transcript_43443:3227-3850(+)